MSVDGVRSPVRLGGPLSTEVVVFVHGNNAGADWTPLMTAVADFARVLAPDLPGFGDADKPDDWDYTVAAYAAHLDGILRQLGVTRAHLVAHDFGGPFALAWAAGHLDMLGSIVLINTPARINHAAARIWRTPVLGELATRLATKERALRFVMRRTDPNLPEAARANIIRHILVPGTKRAVLRLYRATGERAIAAYQTRLGAFTGDALIVWGDRDAYIGVEQAEEQRRMFEHATIRTVAGAGHWPWLERPDVVAEAVAEFLRRQVPRG